MNATAQKELLVSVLSKTVNFPMCGGSWATYGIAATAILNELAARGYVIDHAPGASE